METLDYQETSKLHFVHPSNILCGVISENDQSNIICFPLHLRKPNKNENKYFWGQKENANFPTPHTHKLSFSWKGFQL